MAMNDANTANRPAINWRLAQAIALVAPALGYTVAFTREAAYCHVFKVPVEFISLSWNTIIVSVFGSLAGVYLAMLPFIMLWVTRSSKKPLGPVERRLYLICVIFVTLFVLAFRHLLARETAYVVGFVIVLALMLFLLPLSDPGARKIKGYRNQLEAYDDPSRKRELPFLKLLDLRTIVIFFLFLGAYGGAYLDGRAQALNQEEFLVPSTYPDSIVLRIYGDDMICAPLDPRSKVVEQTYFMLKASDSPKPTFTLTHTGRVFPAGQETER